MPAGEQTKLRVGSHVLVVTGEATAHQPAEITRIIKKGKKPKYWVKYFGWSRDYDEEKGLEDFRPDQLRYDKATGLRTKGSNGIPVPELTEKLIDEFKKLELETREGRFRNGDFAEYLQPDKLAPSAVHCTASACPIAAEKAKLERKLTGLEAAKQTAVRPTAVSPELQPPHPPRSCWSSQICAGGGRRLRELHRESRPDGLGPARVD